MRKREWCMRGRAKENFTIIGKQKVKNLCVQIRCSSDFLVVLNDDEWKARTPEPKHPCIVDSPAGCTCKSNKRTSVFTDENIPVQILSPLPAYLAHLELLTRRNQERKLCWICSKIWPCACDVSIYHARQQLYYVTLVKKWTAVSISYTAYHDVSLHNAIGLAGF